MRASWMAIALMTLPASGFAASPSRSKGACTAAEAWGFATAVPESWRKLVREMIQKRAWGVSSTRRLLAMAQSVPKDPAKRALANYFVARSLYGSGMVHPAWDRFQGLIETISGSETHGIALAALRCMSRIHSQFPGLKLRPGVVAKLPSLASGAALLGEHEALLEVSLPILLAELSDQAQIRSKGLADLFRGQGAWEDFLRAMQAGQKADRATEIEIIRKLAAAPSLPAGLKPLLDFTWLSGARALFDLGKYEESDALYGRIQNTSYFYPRSLIERSWALTQLGKFPEAVGAANSLLVGNLSRTFSPEAHLSILIVMTETCNYVDALAQLQYFRKSYEPANSWLTRIGSDPQYSKPGRLYGLLKSYLKDNTKLSRRLAYEWLRSPVFLAKQAELNRSIDEVASARRALPQLGLRTGANPEARAIYASVIQEGPRLQQRLLSDIHEEMQELAEQMRGDLDRTIDQLKLVEPEIYSLLGEKMIAGDSNDGSAPRKPSRKLATKAQGAWDWGSIKDEDMETAEIWADEIGSLSATLIDRCGS